MILQRILSGEVRIRHYPEGALLTVETLCRLHPAQCRVDGDWKQAERTVNVYRPAKNRQEELTCSQVGRAAGGGTLSRLAGFATQ